MYLVFGGMSTTLIPELRSTQVGNRGYKLNFGLNDPDLLPGRVCQVNLGQPSGATSRQVNLGSQPYVGLAGMISLLTPYPVGVSLVPKFAPHLSRSPFSLAQQFGGNATMALLCIHPCIKYHLLYNIHSVAVVKWEGERGLEMSPAFLQGPNKNTGCPGLPLVQ